MAGMQFDEGQARSDALMALGAGLLGGRGTFGQRLGGGIQAALGTMNQARDSGMARALMQSQLDENQAQALARRAQAEAAIRKQAEQAAFLAQYSGQGAPGAGEAGAGALIGGPAVPTAQDGLPGAPGASGGPVAAQGLPVAPGGQPGAPGGLSGAPGQVPANAAPQAMAPTGPAPAARGVRMTPEMFAQGLIQAGIPLDQMQALATFGQNKVARTIDGRDAQGRPTTIQFDEYGNQVGDAVPQAVKMQLQDLGNRVVPVDPYAPGGPMAKAMTPGEQASNALGRANLGLRQQELALSKAIARSSNAPSGYRVTADGQGLEPIPGGPADPANAKRAAPTEFQGKSAGFGSRAQISNQILTDLELSGTQDAGRIRENAAAVPIIGGVLDNAVSSMLPTWAGAPNAKQQRYGQAKRDFINATLRQESGAAIGESEFANADKQYFPQPGDTPEVIAQKRANREQIVRSFQVNAGPAWQAMDEANKAARPKGPGGAGASGGWSAIDAGGWSARERR